MKKPAASPASAASGAASKLIDEKIASLADWRGAMLSRVRDLVHEADPEVVEEWKWMGTPIWSHGGILCTGESYKSVVKMTFARGAALRDPAGLFNSSLDGHVRRAIDIHEGEKINEPALRALVRAAVALNLESKRSGKSASKQPRTRPGTKKIASPRAARAKPRGARSQRAKP